MERKMIHATTSWIAPAVLSLVLCSGCAGKPKAGRPALAPGAVSLPIVLQPIETMQWGDLTMDCEQIKANYDRLGPLVKDAGRLIPLPNSAVQKDEGTSAITFIPLFGPLIAMGMDSASRERAAFEAAQLGSDPELRSAIIAHQRGHEAIDRRQYLLYLALQKGCK